PGGTPRGVGGWSPAQSTDPQPVIDYGYCRAANTIAKVAQVLGRTADGARDAALATTLADEYNAKYLHTDGNRAWYANDTETSNAIALDACLVPVQYRDAVVTSLVRAVRRLGY